MSMLARNTILLLCGALLLGGCQTPPMQGTSPRSPAAPAAPRASAPAIVFPEHLGGMRRVEREIYPDPRLGVAYHYEARGSRCSVYVYDRGYGHIPDGIQHELVRLEFAEARRDIRLAASRGIYRELRELGTSLRVVDTPAGRQSFLRADYSFRLRHVPRRSVLMLGGSRNRYLKLRCSWRRDADERGRKVLARFVHAVVGYYLK